MRLAHFRRLSFAFAVTAALAPRAATAQWTTHIYGTHVLTAQGEGPTEPDPQVPESSGVISSRLTPDLFWTHNDSGAGPVVWAFRLSAADRTAGAARRLGSVTLSGASAIDWEDIAAGPGGRIYLFDGGDNPPCDRTTKRIHRFTEPAIDVNGSPVSLTLPYESILFEYPSSSNPALPASVNTDRYDCECLFVHPASGDLYLVTKRTTADVGAARVYKLPAPGIAWNSGTVHVLEFVANITSTIGVGSGSTTTVTGGDADAFGRRVVIRRYPAAYEFTLPAGQPFDAVFSQTPVSLSLSGEVQGESICYDAGGQGGNLISTSEVVQFSGIPVGPQRIPFYITPWLLANARATGVSVNKATIRWDTAAALGSTVEYGTTTAYGQTVSNAAAVTAHVIPLTSLLPGTTYYYRVTSGALSHPGVAAAATVFFTTRTHVAPDIDQDGDVDQDDFGLLQRCFSGAGIAQAAPSCQSARLDDDTDVDADDLGRFLACASGADVPWDANCEP